MSEKLIIRNFGPIKDVELEIKKVNVIIGEQATGKSTIAKVLAVCNYFSYIIESVGIENNFEKGLEAWGLGEFIKNDTFIYYECDHYSFSAVRVVAKTIDQQTNEVFGEFPEFSTTLKPLSDQFKVLINEYNSIKPKQSESYGFLDYTWTIPTSFFQNDVASVLDNPFYLPTERGLQSIFSLGKNSIPNIADSLFNQFANLDIIARNFKNETEIEPLNISYKNVDGKGYIRKNNEDKFYSLFNGASGYQSTIPIVLVMKYYAQIRRKRKTFLIEEPELNLFPKAQQELINYLVDNALNLDNKVLLTTHSPYILTSLNNLMYAYEVGQKESEEVNKIIDKKYWINAKEIRAYRLLPNGTAENIIDTVENLINAEKIDSVSGILNEQFDSLLNIELVKK